MVLFSTAIAVLVAFQFGRWIDGLQRFSRRSRDITRFYTAASAFLIASSNRFPAEPFWFQLFGNLVLWVVWGVLGGFVVLAIRNSWDKWRARRLAARTTPPLG